MNLNIKLLQTAMLSFTLIFSVTGVSVYADENQPDTPSSMECVEISGIAKLGPDYECKIANSHHRTEQYPEVTFLYDLDPEACTNPDNPPCCVKGMMSGMIGEYDFVAGAGCGFTVNDLGADAAADLAEIGYQQFTARTLMRVFLNTTALPEHPGENEDLEVKADFGLFLGDSGVSRDDNYVSQHMTLTGARKLPRGTKMELDMVGLPPAREISGTLCGPNLLETLDIIARKGSGRDDDDEDDD